MGVPRQEKWLAAHLKDTGARVGIGVGGLFNFYAGTILALHGDAPDRVGVVASPLDGTGTVVEALSAGKYPVSMVCFMDENPQESIRSQLECLGLIRFRF
jgi:hypothetical protein